MPSPRDDENKQDFLNRCMGDAEARRDFPRDDQRFAFCNSKWTQHLEKVSPTPSDVHVPSTERREREKAEYDGQEVKLGQPFRLPEGSSKKFGVYVRDGDDVKRVTFGDPDMEIKRDDDEARENFRNRFSCDSVTDKTSATYWSCKMWQKGTSVSEILDKEDDVVTKRQMTRDVFTTRREARERSNELGLEGRTHQHNTENGAVFMPGRSHQEYVNAMASADKGMFKQFVDGVMGWLMSNQDDNQVVSEDAHYDVAGTIFKVDEEQRIVYGWASVISENGEPVTDTQGDVIGPDELTKAVNDFMLEDRVGKVMHEGDRTGTIVHSFPITKEIASALGIQTDREGWVVGYHVADDEVWSRVKDGDFTGFSIGGEAQRIPINE